jgi:hypothetical protein
VGKKQRLEVDHLLAQLRHLCAQGIVLAAEDLHLGLQIGEPLLLALTTFERSDP